MNILIMDIVFLKEITDVVQTNEQMHLKKIPNSMIWIAIFLKTSRHVDNWGKHEPRVRPRLEA